MYAGQIIELGPRDAMFRQPAHPYTRALLDAIPHLSQARALTGIPGSTPGPGRRPTACRFNTRCEYVQDRCREIEPEDVQVGPDHTAKCLRVGEIGTWDINRGNTTDTDPHTERDIILTIDDLKVFYGRTEVVHGVTLRRGQGRGGRAGRRVRQRQDHDLALRRRPAQAVDRRR